MYDRRVHSSLSAPTLLALALVLAPSCFAGDAADNAVDQAKREEALRTIMFRWSQTANTKSLALPETTTQVVDTWLDYCRNTYQRRAKPSEQFMGSAHAWFEASGSDIVFHVDFMALSLLTPRMPAKEAPALLASLFTDKFVAAVRVEGDNADLVELWSVMMATQLAGVADQLSTKSGLDAAAWTNAKVAAGKHLLETIRNTPAMTEPYSLPGTMGEARAEWLNGIGALAGKTAGMELKKLLDSWLPDNVERDLRCTAAALAQAEGPEAEAFILAQLSENDARWRTQALSGVRPGSSNATIKKVASLLAESSDNEDLVTDCVWALLRAGKPDSATRKEAETALLKWFKAAPAESIAKYFAAMGLVENRCTDKAPRAFLEELRTKLESERPNDWRIEAINKALQNGQQGK